MVMACLESGLEVGGGQGQLLRVALTSVISSLNDTASHHTQLRPSTREGGRGLALSQHTHSGSHIRGALVAGGSDGRPLG